MFDKRLVRHTNTMHMHVSSQRRFLVRIGGYSVCEGGTAELESKALLWRRNCGTTSRSIFLRGSGTTELPRIIPYAEAELQTLKSHNILCAEEKLRNLKSQSIPTLFARSFRRRLFAYHYAVNHPHTNIILSWFIIPLVLKCAAKILKIGLQIKI